MPFGRAREYRASQWPPVHGRGLTVPASRCELRRTLIFNFEDALMSSRTGLQIIVLALPAICAAQPDESALTIYSSQQPGAMAAEFYRPVPGAPLPAATSVPGYAMVRQDRDVQL